MNLHLFVYYTYDDGHQNNNIFAKVGSFPFCMFVFVCVRDCGVCVCVRACTLQCLFVLCWSGLRVICRSETQLLHTPICHSLSRRSSSTWAYFISPPFPSCPTPPLFFFSLSLKISSSSEDSNKRSGRACTCACTCKFMPAFVF